LALIKEIMRELLILLISISILGCKKEVKNKTIIVHQGESLSVIAQEMSVRTQDLIEWNKLSSDQIFIGQKLKVYYPSVNLDDINFGLSKSELIQLISIPPRRDNKYFGGKLEHLTYMTKYDVSADFMNQKNIDDAVISFGFVDNKLSIINLGYFGWWKENGKIYSFNLEEAAKYLEKKGFKMVHEEYHYNGEGIYKNEKVYTVLAVDESGIWVSYYLDKPQVIAAFNDSTRTVSFR
jgi:hypothetical protein